MSMTEVVLLKRKIKHLQLAAWHLQDTYEKSLKTIQQLRDEQNASVLSERHRHEIGVMQNDMDSLRLSYDKLYKQSNEVARQYDIAKSNLEDYIKGFKEEIAGNKQIRRILGGDEDESSYSEAMIPFIEKIAEELETLRQENEQLKTVVEANAEKL